MGTLRRLMLVVIAFCCGAGVPVSALAGSVALATGEGSFTVPVTSFKEMRFRRVVKQEYDFSCGSAAVATLLTYHYNRPTLENSVLKAMMADGDQAKIRREGFSLLDMKRYLAHLGYHAEGYRVSLGKIAEVGIPGIVLVKTNGYSHFVVLKGIRGDEVLVGDPALGTKTMTRKHFSEIWTGIFFVILNDARVARAEFNDAADWRGQAKAPLGVALSAQSLGTLTLLMPPRGNF
jgi:predicted double-glycine peptidase